MLIAMSSSVIELAILLIEIERVIKTKEINHETGDEVRD